MTTRNDSSFSEDVPSAEALDEARTAVEEWLRSGEPLLAYNAAQEAQAIWPSDLRLRQLVGLALARSGAVQRANQVLTELRDEGHDDGETLGLLGRTHKDLALAVDDAEVRRAHLTAALEIYEGAYRGAHERGNVGETYYTGINAATLALLGGNHERAREIAEHVVALCRGELEAGDGGDYWLLATLGEASLILGDRQAAEHYYGRAAEAAGNRFADIGSTRRQARLLLEHRGEPTAWLEETLAVPPVLVFTGHMIDHPDRQQPRFPAELEDAVRDEIVERVARIGPVAAYGSAACGADILCLETVLELGGEIHITLPFPPAAFREVSVDFVADPGWGERFEKVLAAASSVVVASDHRAEGSASTFDYANLILTGMGILRAQVLETDVVGLAVWDGAAGDGGGGTADMVARWRQRGVEVEHVDLAALAGRTAVAAAPAGGPAEVPRIGSFTHELKAMLFADAVGYSKMSENQIPVFIESFLGAVARLNERTAYRPIHMEVAGDGLYFVFPEAGHAGRYGLELSELVAGTDWQDFGLPGNLDMRVGLHCGPVFCGTDPITGNQIYTGPHTSRTARIEPITPPGQVYGSSAFAAIAAATGVDDLRFDYIGRTSLAKKYGSLALYHVRRPTN